VVRRHLDKPSKFADAGCHSACRAGSNRYLFSGLPGTVSYAYSLGNEFLTVITASAAGIVRASLVIFFDNHVLGLVSGFNLDAHSLFVD
jgi:hypothetical protein